MDLTMHVGRAMVLKFKLIHTGRSSVESHSRYSATWTIWFIIRSSS